MKKKLVACLIASAIALSFAFPVMAADVAIAEPANTLVEHVEIAPLNEMTRIYLRNYGGILQFRVWSITNGRWITDWTTFL